MEMNNGSKRPLGGPRTGRKPSNQQLVLGALGQEIAAKGCCSSALPNGKHPGGRPTKRTPEITALIAEAISFGLTDEEAAALVGIDDDTLTQWKKIPEFSGAIKRAVATRKSQEELTLLLGGIDLKQTKSRNWYRKTLSESEKIEKEAGN